MVKFDRELKGYFVDGKFIEAWRYEKEHLENNKIENQNHDIKRFYEHCNSIKFESDEDPFGWNEYIIFITAISITTLTILGIIAFILAIVGHL